MLTLPPQPKRMAALQLRPCRWNRVRRRSRHTSPSPGPYRSSLEPSHLLPGPAPNRSLGPAGYTAGWFSRAGAQKSIHLRPTRRSPYEANRMMGDDEGSSPARPEAAGPVQGRRPIRPPRPRGRRSPRRRSRRTAASRSPHRAPGSMPITAGLGIVALALAIAVFYLFSVMPSTDRLAADEKALSDLRTQVAAAEAKTANPDLTPLTQRLDASESSAGGLEIRPGRPATARRLDPVVRRCGRRRCAGRGSRREAAGHAARARYRSRFSRAMSGQATPTRSTAAWQRWTPRSRPSRLSTWPAECAGSTDLDEQVKPLRRARSCQKHHAGDGGPPERQRR